VSDQGYNKDHQENEKEDLGYSGCRKGYAAKSEKSSDQRDH
jgi:hypothetical protein